MAQSGTNSTKAERAQANGSNGGHEVNPREGKPSASSMHRVVACSGSVALEAQCPEVETEDSKAGTLGHAYLAGEAVALDDKMQETCDTAERLALQIADAHGFAHITAIKERRLWFHIGTEKIFSGQFDRAYIDTNNDRALVIDYKLLHGDHDEAFQNWQLRTLALLVSHNYGVLSVTVALIQPWKEGQKTLAHYDEQALEDARLDILRVVGLSLLDNAPRIPGDHCKFCKALSICPESAAKAVTVINQENAAATLTPDQRGRRRVAMAYAKDVFKAWDEEDKAMEIANPGSITGWRMKPGNEVRQITNNAALYFDLKAAIGCTMDVFIETCIVSLDPLKAIHKKATGLKGKAAEEAFDALIAPHVVTKQNAASLERVK